LAAQCPFNGLRCGTQSVGEASELIRNGRSDMVITGGVEAVVAGLCHCWLLMPCRPLPVSIMTTPLLQPPFDAKPFGFVFSEGCGIVIN